MFGEAMLRKVLLLAVPRWTRPAPEAYALVAASMKTFRPASLDASQVT